MLALRRVWIVFVGAWGAAALTRALLDWVLGVEGDGMLAVLLVAAAAGGLASLGEARRVRPMDTQERVDSLTGWGALLGGVASVACLFLPLPWSPVAAVAVLALTVVLVRRAIHPAPPAPAGPTGAAACEGSSPGSLP